MKAKKNLFVIFLIGLLSILSVSCSQIEDGETVSEDNTSSQTESISSPESDAASLPESSETESIPESSQSQDASPSSQNTDSSTAENEPTESFDEAQTAAYEVISGDLITYVGSENFDSWRLDMQAQGNAINIKNFVEQFQIDRAALESNAPNLYTAEQLDALYSGDSEAIRTAFGLPANYPIS